MMVSDDETSSVGSNSHCTTTTPDFPWSSQQSPLQEQSDILIESTTFLDDFPEFLHTAPEEVSLDSSESSDEDFMDSCNFDEDMLLQLPVILQ